MSIRLLIVDDEEPVLGLLKATLEPLGAEVVALTSGDEAIQHLERERFDGIVVDVRMPGTDGFEVTRKARASSLNNKAPIVMLSGLDDVETMREGFKAGATFFLGKPIPRERIQNLFKTLQGPMMLQRRRHARLPLKTRVTCRWAAEKDKHIVAESLNIGEGGMLLEASVAVDMGQELILEFTAPLANRPVSVKGKVVRTEQSGRFAVEFVDLQASEHETIQTYIIGKIQG